MKVLFYLPVLTQSGGVERALSSLLNQMSQDDAIEVVLITNYGKREDSYYELSSKIRVIDIGIKQYRKEYLKVLYRLKSVITAENADYIINVETMSTVFTFPLLFFRRKNKTKFLIWEHFNFLNNNGKRLRTLLRSLSARFADGIVTLTSRDVEMWKTHLKIRGKITAIPNISSFSNINNGYNEDSKNFIAVGRLTKVKGFDRLIECWRELLDIEPGLADWKLQIIGGGELHEVIEKQIEQSDLKNNVEIVPQTKEIKKYYESASFICLTSYNEGLPMVLIEAQSFGLPIVAFDCYTGPSEIISEKSGILVTDNDKIGFIQALRRILYSSELRRSMSSAAKKEAIRYNGPEIARAWREFFGQL